jgi:hypothetical protein
MRSHARQITSHVRTMKHPSKDTSTQTYIDMYRYIEMYACVGMAIGPNSCVRTICIARGKRNHDDSNTTKWSFSRASTAIGFILDSNMIDGHFRERLWRPFSEHVLYVCHVVHIKHIVERIHGVCVCVDTPCTRENKHLMVQQYEAMRSSYACQEGSPVFSVRDRLTHGTDCSLGHRPRRRCPLVEHL